MPRLERRALGWRGGEVGPNRFRITFSARTLYIHPVGWCALLWCTNSVHCSGVPNPQCVLLAYILRQCAMVCTWCPGWSFALAKVGEEV